jgi:hypothetical protein
MIEVKTYFVEHGYQIDIIHDGKIVFSPCRDFGIDHDIKELEAYYIQILMSGIEHFRETADAKVAELHDSARIS